MQSFKIFRYKILNNTIQKTKLNLNKRFKTNYIILHEQERKVLPFCTLKVNVPYNVYVKPLDPLSYIDNDRIKIKVKSLIESPVELICDVNEKSIYIFDKTDIKKPNIENKNITCEIESPVKANLEITSNFNVDVVDFDNEFVQIESKNGNITLGKCLSEKINLSTSEGDIGCKGVVQAETIILKTNKNGCISTDRLQGINLNVKTENGDININSSYCNNGEFITGGGNLNLQNLHKDNRINIEGNGNLNLSGLDGTLSASIANGNADVQIARVKGDSFIKILGEGDLKLKLSSSCQENTVLEVLANDLVVDNNIDLNLQRIENLRVLIPKNGDLSSCFRFCLNCERGNVKVESGSWFEALEKRFYGD